jgi:hypothetical protein
MPGTHDLINDGAVSDAPADNAKVGGDNAGTYFVAFGEDATSLYANRAHKALAESTDFLDDVIHADLATPVVTDIVFAGPTTSFVINDEVYVGPFGTPNDLFSQRLVQVQLDTGQLLVWEAPPFNFNVGYVNKIHDGVGPGNNVIGTQADGFYTNPTIDLASSGPPVPAGTYKLVYWTRKNVKTQPAEMLSAVGSGNTSPDALVWALNAQNYYPDGPQWKDAETNVAKSMYDQVSKIITDLGQDVEGSARINSQDHAGATQAGLGITHNTSIYSQLQEIVDFVDAMIDSRANAWGGEQTFDADARFNELIKARKSIRELGADLLSDAGQWSGCCIRDQHVYADAPMDAQCS